MALALVDTLNIFHHMQEIMKGVCKVFRQALAKYLDRKGYGELVIINGRIDISSSELIL